MAAVRAVPVHPKARRCGEMILERLKRAGAVPAEHLIECLGAGDCVPGVVKAAGGDSGKEMVSFPK